MKTFISIILVIGLTPLVSANSLSELKNCASIERDLKRLSCFDKKIKKINGSTEITADNNIDEVVEPPQQKTFKGSFGFENKIAAESADEIHSTILGDFNGWTGKTIFKLANGQVWKQSQSGIMATKKKKNHPVTIKKGVFGSFRLKVEGLNSSINVKRIK